MNKEQKEQTITFGELKKTKISVSKKYVEELLRTRVSGDKVEIHLKDLVSKILVATPEKSFALGEEPVLNEVMRTPSLDVEYETATPEKKCCAIDGKDGYHSLLCSRPDLRVKLLRAPVHPKIESEKRNDVY